MADNTFDSKQYSWSDVTVVVGGRIITGCQSVEYTIKQEKSILRGRGNAGHRILRGNKDNEGKLEVWQSEYEAMVRDAPDKDIFKLEFNVSTAYVPEDGGQTVTDICQTCEVTEVKKGIKQGDGNMIIELPFIFLKHIPQA